VGIAISTGGRRREVKHQIGCAGQAMQGMRFGKIATQHFHAELAGGSGIAGGSNQYDDAVLARQHRSETPADVTEADNQYFLRTLNH